MGVDKDTMTQTQNYLLLYLMTMLKERPNDLSFMAGVLATMENIKYWGFSPDELRDLKTWLLSQRNEVDKKKENQW